MNINLFGSSEIQWWWYVVLGTAVFVLVLTAWACFKHYGVRHHVRDTRSYFLVNSRISQAVETWYESLFRRIAESMPSLAFFRVKKRLVDEEEGGGFIDKIKYS